MIALTSLQQHIYRAAKDAARPITQADLLALVGMEAWLFRIRIKACLEKGYLRIETTGAVMACEPPHDRIVREVCAVNGLRPEQVLSPSKTMKLTRARRTIAMRLEKSNYCLADIAAVVNRDPSTVMDYLSAERAAGRSRIRAAQLNAQRASA